MPNNTALHRFAVLTAAATGLLLVIGGLVTSHGAGMAVPDWPNSNGYNMFWFPVHRWVGGILYEHSHRLWATVVGVLVVALTRWLGGHSARLPLAIVGLAEVAGGIALLKLAPDWKGAGHFLAGIGGVVLMAAAVWFRNSPAIKPLPQLGWIAFAGVQIQGLLGGLRVVLLKDELGIFHATLAQVFFVLLCSIALLASRAWASSGRPASSEPGAPPKRRLWLWFGVVSALILAQLVLGAMMRHEHAGLAIPDFPLAYGKAWPAMDAASIELYNQRRLEITSLNPITTAGIALQMAHRLVAVMILCAVGFCAWATRRSLGKQHPLARWALVWFGLILAQAALGALTIWSNKAADIATAHVIGGALSLATGVLLSLFGYHLGTAGSAAFARVEQSAALTAEASKPQTPGRLEPSKASGSI